MAAANLSPEIRRKVYALASSGISFAEALARVLNSSSENSALSKECDGKGCNSMAPLERPVRSLSVFEETLVRNTVEHFLPHFRAFSKIEQVAMLELYEAIRNECLEKRVTVEYRERNSVVKRDKAPSEFGSSRRGGFKGRR